MPHGAWVHAKTTATLQTRSEGCQVRPKKSRYRQAITVSGLLQQSKLPHVTQISAVSCVDIPSLFLLSNKTCWLQTSPLETWWFKSTCRCFQATLYGSMQGGPDPTLISITTKGHFLLECLVLNTRLNLFHSPVPWDRLSHGGRLISGQSLQHCMRSMQGLAVKCTEEGWRWDLLSTSWNLSLETRQRSAACFWSGPSANLQRL